MSLFLIFVAKYLTLFLNGKTGSKKQITGKVNITYAGRTLATANGLSAEKRAVYLAAIKRAMNNPEYIQKEAKNRNHLMFAEGEGMWKLLEGGQAVAEKAAYWKQKGVQ